jgi:hypothetical protein
MADFSGGNIYNLLYDIFGQIINNDARFDDIVIVADNNYQSIESADWLRDFILNEPILAKDKYRKDIFDCDDYVIYLKSRMSLLYANNSKYKYASAVGYLITSRHAFNIAIDKNGELNIVNTQSDTVAKFNTAVASDRQIMKFLDIDNGDNILSIYI